MSYRIHGGYRSIKELIHLEDRLYMVITKKRKLRSITTKNLLEKELGMKQIIKMIKRR